MVVSRLPFALIVAALLEAGAAAQPGQDPTVRPVMPSFKSSATQVAVTAAVRYANGTPVTTLTRDDFQILDNQQFLVRTLGRLRRGAIRPQRQHGAGRQDRHRP